MTDPRKPSDCLPEVKAALVKRGEYICFDCIAKDAGMSIEDVTRCMRHGLLMGFTFRSATCDACKARAWCASYRPPAGFLI